MARPTSSVHRDLAFVSTVDRNFTLKEILERRNGFRRPPIIPQGAATSIDHTLLASRPYPILFPWLYTAFMQLE